MLCLLLDMEGQWHKTYTIVSHSCVIIFGSFQIRLFAIVTSFLLLFNIEYVIFAGSSSDGFWNHTPPCFRTSQVSKVVWCLHFPCLLSIWPGFLHQRNCSRFNSKLNFIVIHIYSICGSFLYDWPVYSVVLVALIKCFLVNIDIYLSFISFYVYLSIITFRISANVNMHIFSYWLTYLNVHVVSLTYIL